MGHAVSLFAEYRPQPDLVHHTNWFVTCSMMCCCAAVLTAGLKSLLLEKKLEAVVEQLEVKEAQLAEVLAAANLDPHTLQQVRPWQLPT